MERASSGRRRSCCRPCGALARAGVGQGWAPRDSFPCDAVRGRRHRTVRPEAASDPPGRQALPARRDLGRRGNELLALLRARRARSSSACSTAGRLRGAARLPRPDGVQLARLPARSRARAALRLPRPRALRARPRARFNPAKLLIDPYAKAIEGGVRLGRGADVRRRTATAAGRARRRGRRGRRSRSAIVIDPCVRLGGRPAAARRRGPRR